MQESGSFAKTIMEQKYSHVKGDGSLETWGDIARRVAVNVMGAVGASAELTGAITKVIAEKKFIPGGRYLYASGRPLHQVCNCLPLSVEDSREGWADLLWKSSLALMTGAGIGVNYSRIRPEGDVIKRTGGYATGPIALMQIENGVSKGVVQGGARRGALLAILSWKHQDIYKFIALKNWPDHIRALKGKDVSFPATMDGTNISVQLDDEFFEAFHNTSHTLHSHASSVYWAVVRQMLETGEPGFTVDVGENSGEILRNAPVSADTHVLTGSGYFTVGEIIDKPVTVWTGKRWVDNVVFTKTMENAPIVRVSLSNGKHIKCEPNHEFLIERRYAGLQDIIRRKAMHLMPGDKCSTGDFKGGILDSGMSVTVTSMERLEEKEDVYCCNVGVEEHSFMAEGVIISNCGEITSSDDSDICNLGSINIARIESLEEMKTVVELGTAFLLAGSVYSDVPYEEVRNVRDKNRRLGLGLMGLHEWLLKHGKTYGPDEELGKYIEVYAGNKEIAARFADTWGLSRPVKTRAVAPTGTTGIVAETTTGIEPVFCAAYKRRYWRGTTLVEYQYVLDPTAKRLVESGISPDAIEDAYTLSENVERRVEFQAWIQRWIDHGVSSTLNLPAWGTEHNNQDKAMPFGNMLIKYLPQLRGITAYPDGGRSGQPLTPIKYHTAAKHAGQVFVETVDVCDLKGGSCGA